MHTEALNYIICYDIELKREKKNCNINKRNEQYLFEFLSFFCANVYC